jgi:hypothetical protein
MVEVCWSYGMEDATYSYPLACFKCLLWSVSGRWLARSAKGMPSAPIKVLSQPATQTSPMVQVDHAVSTWQIPTDVQPWKMRKMRRLRRVQRVQLRTQICSIAPNWAAWMSGLRRLPLAPSTVRIPRCRSPKLQRPRLSSLWIAVISILVKRMQDACQNKRVASNNKYHKISNHI